MEGIPDPALVVLIGPSGSGKSTWAAERFRPEEIVSSDRLRAMVGSGEHDLQASPVAFSLLDQMVEARLRRRLLTVVDTLGLDDERRIRHLNLAHDLDLPAVAVVFEGRESVARQRNRARERPVPAGVLTSQIRRFRQILPRLADEGWRIVTPGDNVVITSSYGPLTARPPARPDRSRLRFFLQVSRFVGEEPLASRLAEIARAAEKTGFAGLALMDHLIQIPQVGREWEDLPEAYTGLAYLAGVSTKLELGALVTGVGIRNPGLLAKMIATLDVLSGGRAFCGLGLGWFEGEQRAYGYAMETPAVRRAMLEDTLHILPLMWGPGKATYGGKIHSVSEASCYPRPLHHVRILVGGRGDRTVAIAARLADGINLRGAENLDDRIGRVRRELERVGRDAAQFEISVLDLPLIGADRATVAARTETFRGRVTATTFAARHHAGTTESHIDRFAHMSSVGVGAVFVSPVGLKNPEEVEMWKPVIEAFK